MDLGSFGMSFGRTRESQVIEWYDCLTFTVGLTSVWNMFMYLFVGTDVCSNDVYDHQVAGKDGSVLICVHWGS